MKMEIVNECAVKTQSRLPPFHDYKETNYQQVLIYELQKRGFKVSSEENITYSFNDKGFDVIYGFGRLDLKCIGPDGDTWIMELKCVSNFKYMDNYRAQLTKYLHHYKVQNRVKARGVLIIFNNDGKKVYCEELTHILSNEH